VNNDELAPLAAGYRVVPFAGDVDAALGLWAREGVMDAEEAARRVHEVVCVGLGPADELVALSTAYLRRSRQLGMTLWYSRVFVAADHRMANLAFRLALEVRDHFRERWVSGEDTRAAGMMFEVHNRALRGHLVNATWRSDYTFVGTTREGDHMRVHYFPGAQAPLPGDR
jgi:hypothetical protein